MRQSPFRLKRRTLTLAAALALVTLSATAQDGVTRIVFATGPDDTGTVQGIVDSLSLIHI